MFTLKLHRTKIAILLFFGLPAIASADFDFNLSYSFGDVYFDTLQGYDVVIMQGCERTRQLGSPWLPVSVHTFIISSNCSVDSAAMLSANFDAFKGQYNIVPAQPEIPTSVWEDPPEWVEPDSSVYLLDEFYPDQQCIFRSDGFFDATNHIVRVETRPIRYNPVQQTMELATSMTIRIYTSSASAPVGRATRYYLYQEYYDRYLEALVENPGDIPIYGSSPMPIDSVMVLSVPGPPVSFYPFVVITVDSLMEYYEPYVEWLNRKGIRAGIVSLSAILNRYAGDPVSGINDNAGDVRAYLMEGYYDQEIVDWCLLAGLSSSGVNPEKEYPFEGVPVRIGASRDIYDNESNPHFSECMINTFDACCPWCKCSWYGGEVAAVEEQHAADLYFREFGGDWDVDGDAFYGEHSNDDPEYDPEIWAGRLPLFNGEQIFNWTSKILNYEQNPGNGSYSYLLSAYLGAADQMRNTWDQYSSSLKPYLNGQGISASISLSGIRTYGMVGKFGKP
jgi:hypothetical protein